MNKSDLEYILVKAIHRMQEEEDEAVDFIYDEFEDKFKALAFWYYHKNFIEDVAEKVQIAIDVFLKSHLTEDVKLKGYKLRKVLTEEDLKAEDYAFVLEYISFEEVKGNYTICKMEPTEFTPDTEGPLKLPITQCPTIVTNVDRRVFYEKAVAFTVGDDLWITEEECERVTT